MGEAELCMAYYDQPELIHDMLDTIGETAVRVLERVMAAVQVDVLFVHEDMAGKSGPLAGPRQVEEFIAPYYRRVWDAAPSLGRGSLTRTATATCGRARRVSGCRRQRDAPMEPAAGMDIVQIREQYGTRLAFYGGIDKHVMRRSKDEIVAELEYKIPPMVASGGCVLALRPSHPQRHAAGELPLLRAEGVGDHGPLCGDVVRTNHGFTSRESQRP